MYKEQKILCIISARGGSKRLPGKNILLLNGKPLITYAIEAAQKSAYIDECIVSTDDEVIANVAREYGATVPFLRPSELADDNATSLAVLQHAVQFYEKNEKYFDIIVLIQPTVPGVEVQDVDAAIVKLDTAHVNSCISICEITDRPEWMYSVNAEGRIAPFIDAAYHSQNIRSQDLPELYRINGAVYVTRHSVLMTENKIIDKHSCAAVLMPKERSIDIDTQMDFVFAETLLKNKAVKNS